jgi:hypothetical protein
MNNNNNNNNNNNKVRPSAGVPLAWASWTSSAGSNKPSGKEQVEWVVTRVKIH